MLHLHDLLLFLVSQVRADLSFALEESPIRRDCPRCSASGFEKIAIFDELEQLYLFERIGLVDFPGSVGEQAGRLRTKSPWNR